jgi:hypothetical protein
MPNSKEIWKPVGHLRAYEASSFGQVRFASSGKLKPLTVARSGFMVVNLYAHGISNVRNVHSVIAEAFLGPLPVGYMVVHIDSNPQNNRIDNLVFKHLGERRAKSLDIEPGSADRLNGEQAAEIHRRAHEGAGTVELAREFGISAPMVSGIKHGRKWRMAGHGRKG